ncbi:hypothetical protein P308_18975 [Pseudomonas piscis]|nr:hypothetical protein P308_18975 [Pseudomonas piscis]
MDLRRAQCGLGPEGELLAAVGGVGEALLLVRGGAGQWQAQVLWVAR